MKLATIALAVGFVVGPTLAFAQTGSNAGPDRMTTQGKKETGTAGSAKSSGRNTGDAITTGSDVPRDKPMLSNSPESSDTSQKVK